jgi:diguanylate cyclase (GGDEF)-like protein/PAS domain S-box-containing protein
MRKERILIVDDTPANIDVLGAILTEEYEISVAVSGQMAIDIAEADPPPDLILLDIMMPRMDGYQVARHLKASEKTRQIPVIFVTAKIEDTDEAYGFEIGAVDYIRKPVNASVTRARVKSHLELKKYRDSLTQLVEERDSEIQTSRDRLESEQQKLQKAQEDLLDNKAMAHKHQVYFRELFMNSPYGIILVGSDRRIISVNNSCCRLLGYSISEILNAPFPGMADNTEAAYLDMVNKAFNGETACVETWSLHKNGFRLPISALAYPVRINHQVQGVFVFFENISQRKLFEEKLKHQAYHDALTGIPNRLLFTERLDYALEKQKLFPSFKFAVLLLDLDRFKSINDTLGHQAGDQLLKQVSARIAECLRVDDTLARLGGDEFGILLPDIEDPEQITAIARRISAAAESTFLIDNQEVGISASIGIVEQTSIYENGNHLLRDADLAMYHAKDSGKAQFKYFNSRMREELIASVTMEQDLRVALVNDEMILHFQPIIQVLEGRLQGFEALIRWQHPQQGMVPPDRFIPLAEESGLILPLGDWIIDTALSQLALPFTHK